MPTPSNIEQEILELMNRARSNPGAEIDKLIDAAAANINAALSYFGVDMAALRDQLAAFPAVAPLAWNDFLSQSATDHSERMIAADTQSHQLPGEASLGSRIVAVGYNKYLRLAENIYAFSEDALFAHAGFLVDWGYDDVDFGSGNTLLPNWRTLGDGMQDEAGHRIAMLSAKYTEVGIAAIADNDAGTSVGPWVVTEDFGARTGYVPQLVGVIFDDADGDRFYDAGEGAGGVTITATRDGKSYSTLAWSSGGYQIELPAGTYEVTFSGGGLAAPVTRTITIGGQNVKLDLNTDDVPADPNAVLGGSGNDWLNAKTFGHLINGFEGVDMASFVAATARVVVDLNTGTAVSNGETWTLLNIENVTGSIFGDLITGDAGANRLRGLGDYDWLVGSGGGDVFDGGTGRDTVAYSSATGSVAASLLAKAGTLGQAAGDSYISIENLTGSSYADRLTGDNDRNILRGLAGDDFIFGLDGNDTIDGGAGRDVIDGGRGNDRITGGRGNDSIDGGLGWDTAIYSGNKADYTITHNADDSFSVLHLAGGSDGVDVLLNIEALQFSDGRLYL